MKGIKTPIIIIADLTEQSKFLLLAHVRIFIYASPIHLYSFIIPEANKINI